MFTTPNAMFRNVDKKLDFSHGMTVYVRVVGKSKIVPEISQILAQYKPSFLYFGPTLVAYMLVSRTIAKYC